MRGFGKKQYHQKLWYFRGGCFKIECPQKITFTKETFLGRVYYSVFGVVVGKESVLHFFFERRMFVGVWYAICNRFNVLSKLHNEGLLHSDQFAGLLGSGRIF